MPSFRYIALDERGRRVESAITATSKDHAKKSLVEAGLFVQKVHKQISFSYKKQDLSHDELYRIIKSLRSLLNAGLSITESLEALVDEPETPRIGQYIDLIYQGVLKGESLSSICRAHPQLFDRLLASAFEMGEKSGNLVKSLDNYLDTLEQRILLNRKVKAALSYPLFLMAALAAVMGLLFIYVIPNFSEMFESFEADLPLPTQIVLSLSQEAPLWVGLFAIGVAIIISLTRISETNDQLAMRMDRIFLKLPKIGGLRSRVQRARLSNMMSGLLQSGATLIEVLDLSQKSFQGTKLGKSLGKSKDDIVEGTSLHMSFKKRGIFSGYALKMLAVGERSSEIDTILSDIASFYQEELNESLDRFTKLLEPALILFMGLLMGFVIVAMYLPIFYMAEIVQ